MHINFNMDDKVALLTPTNGKKQFWRLMLQNIKQQQYPHENITWYILDDSTKKSNDGLHDKIDFFKEQLAPIQVVFKSRKKCQSLGKKRNLLVEMTKGEPYLLHMDDDDFYQPNWIKSCVDGLKSNQGKGVIGSVVLPTCFIHERKDKTCVQLVKAGDHPSHVYPGTLAYTRDYYNQFGGFSDVDKNEAVEFANHNQTLVMNPHAPIMRLTPHPQAKHVWKTVTRPDVESGKDVNATIPDPLMEMFGKCAFDDEKFVFENPDDKLPNVGLAMPTYCRKRFYPNIIDNLKRQTYPLHKLTLYIYDDSPPGKGFHEYVDEMREKIHPVKLVFISGMEQIKPLGKKRNELVKYIQEPYIANMDDDDFYHPTWLRRVITVLLDNPDKGLVGCVEMPHIYIHSQFDKWKLILNNPNAYKMPEDKKKLEFIGEASMAYTREYFESQGGYGEQMIQEGVKFIDPKRTIDISCLDILISVNLHPDEVGHVSWNTSNKNMLFDKQQVGFNMPPEQALKIARCAFNDQNFNFGDSNPFKLPEIAVVTPTRDSAAFENVMIENMKRQTYPHELIHWYILDDSNDKNAMVSEENIRKKLGDKIKLVFKKLPKAVNPIGLKRNLLVKGVKQDIVVHMDDAQHYMKAYVNIMVTELRSNEKRKVVGSGVTPYVYVHEDLEKWKLIGMAFGPANDPMTICPTMMAYYKSYFDERDGFGGNEIPLQQQHPWMGQEVKKMIDPPKAHTIQALDKLMMYLCSHPESSKQTQRVGWDTTFAYKWFQNNGSDLDKLQISENDKQTIARGVFDDKEFKLSGINASSQPRTYPDIKPTRRESIAFMIPTTTKKRNHKTIEDTEVVSIFLKNLKLSNHDRYDYSLYLGYDTDDELFHKNKDKLNKIFQNIQPKLKLKQIVLPDSTSSVVEKWNYLFENAYKDNIDWFYQLGDDINIIDENWDKEFVNILKSRDGWGVTGPLDLNNASILTQSFVGRKHYDIFKKNYFDNRIKNWHCDNWITEVYKPELMTRAQSKVKNMSGFGSERYVVDKSAGEKLKDYVSDGKKKIGSAINNNDITEISSVATLFNKGNNMPIKKASAVITGLCKDVEKELPVVLQNMKKMASYFDKSQIIIFENGSKDKTREILSKTDNVTVIGSNDIVNGITNRIERIMKIRNYILEYVKQKNIHPDYLISCDMDDVLTHMEGFETCFETSDWSATFPISNGRYYDIYALRNENVQSDCWIDIEKAIRNGMDPEMAKEQFVYQHQKDYRNQASFNVISAFNGIGVYKWSKIQHLKYTIDSQNGCEHVLFHKNISGNKVVNTRFRVNTCDEHLGPYSNDTKPTVYLPKQPRNDVFNHKGDSFRELVKLWGMNNYVNIKTTHYPYVYMEHDDKKVLLYDLDQKNTLIDRITDQIKCHIILSGNEVDERMKSWTFWGRHPVKLHEKHLKGVKPWEQRSVESLFLGKIENSTQEKHRTQHDWSTCVEEFSCPLNGKWKYNQDEYLERLSVTKFGLCLPGYGPKCNREIELMGLGVVPIITPGVDTQNYINPLKEGIHYLYAETPNDVKKLIRESSKKQWEIMSKNVTDWYNENASPKGSFELTKSKIQHYIPKIDFVYSWCGEKHDNSNRRNRSCNELKYSIRSLMKYAPWLNHIYILVNTDDMKTPSFWNEDYKKKITLIDRCKLFNWDCKETRNCFGVYTVLHKIPGLSELFISIEDDIMLTRSVQPSDFFDGNKPIIYEPENVMNVYQNNFPDGYKSNFPKLKYAMYSHHPIPLTRTMIISFYEKYTGYDTFVQQHIDRFDDIGTVQGTLSEEVRLMYIYEANKFNKITPSSKKILFDIPGNVRNYSDISNELRSYKNMVQVHNDIKVICFNDSWSEDESIFNIQLKHINNFFDELIDIKLPFESSKYEYNSIR